MSTHFLWPHGMSYLNRWGLLDKPEEAREAARIIDRSITEARAYLSTAFGSDLA